MSKQVLTYMKRELRKVLPVFIFAVLYAAGVFIITGLRLSDVESQVLLGISEADFGRNIVLGDLFLMGMSEIMDKFHFLAVVIIEMFLIQRVFYQENRAGVSDFLRILPIKERDKVLMKICAGEAVLAGFCLAFGCFGSIANAFMAPEIRRMESLFDPALTGGTANVYVILWQTVLLMFLALSAIFLILFAARCCVHSVFLANIVGIGTLLTPFFFSAVAQSFLRYPNNMLLVTGSLVGHYPTYTDVSPGAEDVMLSVVHVALPCLGKITGFIVAVILVAAVVIALSLWFRWNIQESNNRLINSLVVSEFVITGVSFCIGTAVAYIFCDASYLLQYNTAFFVTGLIVTVVVWILIHAIIMFVSNRRRAS